MSTEIMPGNKSESGMIKPENPKEVLLVEYWIHAEHFNLPMSTCSDLLTYIRRGAQDSRNGTAQRLKFIKDALEAFYKRRVKYKGNPGIVVALRLKSMRRLAFERKTSNPNVTGVMEACIKYDHPLYRPLWVDTKKLIIIN